MMTFRYYGSLENLQHILASNGLAGKWEPKPNGVFMLRIYDGSNLHWSETKKTLWFSGKEFSKRSLAVKVENMLIGVPEAGSGIKAANDTL